MTLLLAQAVAASVESALLERGVLGITCLILLGAVVVLWRDNRQLQAGRLADHQTFTAKIVETHTTTVVAVTNANAALEAHRESNEKLQEGFRDMAEECRKGRR